jgi:hypothetical protein
LHRFARDWRVGGLVSRRDVLLALDDEKGQRATDDNYRCDRQRNTPARPSRAAGWQRPGVDGTSGSRSNRIIQRG